MKKQEAIKTLKEYNLYRRDGKDIHTMPDPKIVGEAIDTAIAILSANGYSDRSYKKDYEDTKSILDAGVGELQFANMQNEFLYNAVDEIQSMTSDNLAGKLAEMSKERYNLDRIIHARMIFEK